MESLHDKRSFTLLHANQIRDDGCHHALSQHFLHGLGAARVVAAQRCAKAFLSHFPDEYDLVIPFVFGGASLDAGNRQHFFHYEQVKFGPEDDPVSGRKATYGGGSLTSGSPVTNGTTGETAGGGARRNALRALEDGLFTSSGASSSGNGPPHQENEDVLRGLTFATEKENSTNGSSGGVNASASDEEQDMINSTNYTTRSPGGVVPATITTPVANPLDAYGTSAAGRLSGVLLTRELRDGFVANLQRVV